MPGTFMVQDQENEQPRPTTVPFYVVIVGLGCLWLLYDSLDA